MILIGVATYRRAARTMPVWVEKMAKAVKRDAFGGLLVAADGAHALEAVLPLAGTGWGIEGGKTRVGVAANKNRIINYFLRHKTFTHLFLFEDDCWPIAEGWDEFYLDHHRLGQTECLLFLPARMYGQPAWSRLLPEGRALLGFERDGGMLLSLTRKAVETCGGFHRAFKQARYGGEHSELVRRLKRNGLMPWTYLSPRGCEAYLDGWDYASWRGDLRSQPGFEDWLADLRANAEAGNDVAKLPKGEQRKEAEAGLAIFDRVKDDGSVFHDPKWE